MLPKTVNASVSGAMKIKLDPDNKVLDEVVVTAMGITREKKALGYASQVLDAKDLNTSGTSSLASAMLRNSPARNIKSLFSINFSL